MGMRYGPKTLFFNNSIIFYVFLLLNPETEIPEFYYIHYQKMMGFSYTYEKEHNTQVNLRKKYKNNPPGEKLITYVLLMITYRVNRESIAYCTQFI